MGGQVGGDGRLNWWDGLAKLVGMDSKDGGMGD